MISRWIQDLRAVLALRGTPRKGWAPDIDSSEVGSRDVLRVLFIIGLSMIPAAIIFALTQKGGAIPLPEVHPVTDILTSPAPRLPGEALPIAQFFSVPMRIIANLVLMSAFFLMGARFAKIETTFNSTFRVALRVFSVQPILEILHVWKFGSLVELAILMWLAIRASVVAFGMSERAATAYFVAVYGLFIMLQARAYVL